MRQGRHTGIGLFARLGLAVIAAAAVFAADMSSALAQNQACTQIVAMLRGIERNTAFTNYNNIVASLRETEARVRDGESLWIRGGCQQTLNAGQALSRECQTLAQTITGGRSQVQQLTFAAREGQNLAQNREALLQDSARFNCGAGNQSGVTFGQSQRQPLLNELFGAGDPQFGNDYVDSPFNPWSTMATRRTVCVRTCDGFYWPISFSTTDDFIAQDAISCHEMCPGTEVLLFSYRNPGEEPENMISLSGVPYRSMPYAFKFREAVASDCACRQREVLGSIALADAEGGQSRAVIEFGDLTFPLPQRDPRRTVEAVATAAATDLVEVPLPRPRPRDDGTVAPVASPASQSGGDLRIVNFGDRRVRIVGPETPYVPSAEGAS
ncbi:DUF2865 domain-containing protein [Pelagibacterium limicola]|uniref:DUF2865 domain-containing protein n=1 Tax=Pelagibacterium limicola TaxID=2791022 RepID=UPI0018AF5D3F|nr:DUF2865 domain-containing protein [Pelagibacterium limicola]